MNTDEIEKIALEVAHMGCTTYRHQPVEHGEKYMFSEQHMLDFATRFLSRIDDERGKEAVAWVDTLDTARPRCITSLDYRSLIEAELGVEYVPLFLSPNQTIPEGYVLVPIELLKDLDGEHLANGDGIFFSEYIAAAQGERK